MNTTNSVGSLTVVMVAFRNDVTQVSTLLNALVHAGTSSGYLTSAVLVVNDETRFDQAPGLRIIQGQGNVGFARGVELGIECAAGDYVVIVNPDCMPDEDAFVRMFRGLRPDRSISVPLLVDERKRVAFETYEDWVFTPGRRLAATVCKRFFSQSTSNALPPFVKVCGAFVVMQRSLAQELQGPFDTSFFLYGEDRDLSWRARRAKVKLLLRRDVRIVHLGGVSGASVSTLVTKARADSCLRIAYRRYGRVGVWLMAMDLLLGASLSRNAKGTSQFRDRLWAIKRWMQNTGEADPLTVQSLSTSSTSDFRSVF